MHMWIFVWFGSVVGFHVFTSVYTADIRRSDVRKLCAFSLLMDFNLRMKGLSSTKLRHAERLKQHLFWSYQASQKVQFYNDAVWKIV